MIDLPQIEDFRARTRLQIRFNDIDILGHVNNTVYFSFYDTGKAYYLQAARNGKIDFKKVESVIANINCSFVKSIYFGEEIEVYTRCAEIGDKSFVLEQAIVATDTGDIRSVARTVMVMIDQETGKSIAVPDEWRRDFCRFEGREL